MHTCSDTRTKGFLAAFRSTPGVRRGCPRERCYSTLSSLISLTTKNGHVLECQGQVVVTKPLSAVLGVPELQLIFLEVIDARFLRPKLYDGEEDVDHFLA